MAFWARASNLESGDANNNWDVFLRDREIGTTRRVSVRSDGSEASGGGFQPAISGDGRFVAFSSDSSLTTSDVNSFRDVFVHDLGQVVEDRPPMDGTRIENIGAP